jgi:hypothetical protein
MSHLSTAFVFALCAASNLCGAEIKVLLNPENQNVRDALIVVFPKKVAVTQGQTVLKYKILNRSSEDLFVVVESKNIEGWTNLKGPSGMGGGGGRQIGMESMHESLRLLYAPKRLEDGTLANGEDEMVSETVAKVKVDPGYQRDLTSWIGGSGTLLLPIKYYVGGSKDRRLALVHVPIEFQKSKAAKSADEKASK